MSQGFYQCVYDRGGKLLLDQGGHRDRFKGLRFWNDACWDACVPRDTTGLTYLDIGANEGIFPLRFCQSGGVGHGCDLSVGERFAEKGHVKLDKLIGLNYPLKNYRRLQAMYPEYRDFKVFVGGFNDEGGFIPTDAPTYDIVSCLNVLEYHPKPKECIETMFGMANSMVMIATDITPGNKPRYSPGRMHMQNVFNLLELLEWVPWSSYIFKMDLGGPEVGRHQAFIVSYKEKSLPPQLSDWDRTFQMTETQRNRGLK